MDWLRSKIGQKNKLYTAKEGIENEMEQFDYSRVPHDHETSGIPLGGRLHDDRCMPRLGAECPGGLDPFGPGGEPLERAYLLPLDVGFLGTVGGRGGRLGRAPCHDQRSGRE